MRKIILGLTPIMVLMSGSAVAAAPGWKISEVSGDVRLIQNGRPQPAAKGAMLGAGSTIATGPNARAVIVRGEEFVVISPRTQLRVPAEAAPNAIMQLIEDFGTAIFKIQKKSTPHFGVQTPYLAAVVKGTTFTVTAGAEGASVQVTEGAVQVSTLDGGAAELVRPGNIAMVGASDLYRLNLDGETSKVVRSPNAPAHEGSSAAPAAKSAAYSGPRGQEVRISKRFDDDVKSLKEATKGLVEGGSEQAMAQAEFREQAQAARREGANPGYGDQDGNPTKGDDNGKPDDAGKPGDKGNPSDPAKPGDKDKPADPAKPNDKPAEPAKPDPKPADPAKPDPKPADPVKPDPKPVDPVKPDDKGKPADPVKPVETGKPNDPAKPGDVDKPANAEKPGPDKPGKDGLDSEHGKAGDDDDDDDNKGPGKQGKDD